MAMSLLSRYQGFGTQSIANTWVLSQRTILRVCYKIFTGLLALATSRVIRWVISTVHNFTLRYASISQVSMNGWLLVILHLYCIGCVKRSTFLAQFTYPKP